MIANETINSAAVTVTAPATGIAPVTTASEDGTNYTCGTVIWTPDDNLFQGGTRYTATVMLTASTGYTFPSGFTATMSGQTATVANNTGNVVTLSYQFAATVVPPTITTNNLPDGTVNTVYSQPSPQQVARRLHGAFPTAACRAV